MYAFVSRIFHFDIVLDEFVLLVCFNLIPLSQVMINIQEIASNSSLPKSIYDYMQVLLGK